MVRSSGPVRPVQLPAQSDRQTTWVEPTCSTFSEPDGEMRTQVILRDVTVQLARQEGLEAYARQTVATREEERRRIARDLHDGPVQSLVLLWRQLDAIEGSVDPADRRTLAEARALAEQIADELRRVSRDLRPSLLDDLGLGPALKAEVATVADRAGLTGRYVETGQSRRLAPDTELTLLRIAQEALHNVERHAGAKRVLVRLGFGPSEVRMSITDDGQGIIHGTEPFGLLAEGKLGIVGMRERARLAGGEVRLRSGPQRGTTVSVLVPAS
jgi:signal transduction histidine kinase